MWRDFDKQENKKHSLFVLEFILVYQFASLNRKLSTKFILHKVYLPDNEVIIPDFTQIEIEK